MSSIRSASSSAKYVTRRKFVEFFMHSTSTKRPGVATTISAPARSFLNWSRLETPPKIAQHRAPDTPNFVNLCASFAICDASSRVGASTSAIGPSRFVNGLCLEICAYAGSKNASVFPDPVFAITNASCPLQITGKHCA